MSLKPPRQGGSSEILQMQLQVTLFLILAVTSRLAIAPVAEEAVKTPTVLSLELKETPGWLPGAQGPGTSEQPAGHHLASRYAGPSPM